MITARTINDFEEDHNLLHHIFMRANPREQSRQIVFRHWDITYAQIADKQIPIFYQRLLYQQLVIVWGYKKGKTWIENYCVVTMYIFVNWSVTNRLTVNEGYKMYLDLCSLSGKTFYRHILWSFEAVRLDVKITASLWHLTGISAVLLPRCMSNFRTIG